MMRIQRWVTAATLAAASVGIAGAGDANGNRFALPTFDAVYAAQWNGIRLGEIHIHLRRDGEFCYEYTSQAKPVRLVRAFYGTPRERSYFCLADNRVRPVHFEFDHGKDSFALDFDWVNGVVRGGSEGERELPEDAQDRFGMQQAVRAWMLSRRPEAPEGDFTFSMVDDDRIRDYTLRVTGEHSVSTPAGSFDTWLLERADPDRIARFWLAPDADAMPVRVETGRDGKVQLRMDLQSYERTEGPR